MLKLVSRREDGVCYLMLLNNSGVLRSVGEGERLDHTADAEVRVNIKDGRALKALEGDGRLTGNEDGSYTVTVPAGGWFFGRF